MLEKYSKKRGDPFFFVTRRTEDRGGGIGHSSSLMNWVSLLGTVKEERK